MRKIFILILIEILLVGCPSDDFNGSKSLCIKNTSSETIYYWFSYDFTDHHYPNNTLPIIIPLTIRGAGIGSCVGNDIGTNPTWGNAFSQLPSGKFTVYFFDKLATTQEQWEDIRVNHMVLRKDVTYEELKNNNYTIYYP